MSSLLRSHRVGRHNPTSLAEDPDKGELVPFGRTLLELPSDQREAVPASLADHLEPFPVVDRFYSLSEVVGCLRQVAHNRLKSILAETQHLIVASDDLDS